MTKTPPPQEPGPLIAQVPQSYEAFVDFDRLTPHPANPNMGDEDLLGELLEVNGFAGAILAQQSTGIIIDGEHRRRVAMSKGLRGGPVIWLDVDDAARDKLLASWNEAGRRGINDEAKLVALLRPMTDLRGSAFTAENLAAMTHRLQVAGKFDATDEWEGMPRFNNPGKESAYTTVVHFPTHADVTAFFALIKRPVVRSLWWPEFDGHQGNVPGQDEVAG